MACDLCRMPWAGATPPTKVDGSPQCLSQAATTHLPTSCHSDNPKAALQPGEAGVQGAGRAPAWVSKGLGSGSGSATGWHVMPGTAHNLSELQFQAVLSSLMGKLPDGCHF